MAPRMESLTGHAATIQIIRPFPPQRAGGSLDSSHPIRNPGFLLPVGLLSRRFCCPFVCFRGIWGGNNAACRVPGTRVSRAHVRVRIVYVTMVHAGNEYALTGVTEARVQHQRESVPLVNPHTNACLKKGPCSLRVCGTHDMTTQQFS